MSFEFSNDEDQVGWLNLDTYFRFLIVDSRANDGVVQPWSKDLFENESLFYGFLNVQLNLIYVLLK